MDSIFIFVTIIIAIILLLLIVNKNNKNNNNNEKKQTSDKPGKIEYFDQTVNSYSLIGNEDEYKDSVEGYENELMYQNNLKEGDYVHQFKEIDLSKIPKSNNQIGFNPRPRESSESKLPFANINVNCLI